MQVVYGPGTFLNRAVAAVNTQIRRCCTSIAGERAQRRERRLPAGARPALSHKQALTAAKAAGQLEQQQQTSSSSSCS